MLFCQHPDSVLRWEEQNSVVSFQSSTLRRSSKWKEKQERSVSPPEAPRHVVHMCEAALDFYIDDRTPPVLLLVVGNQTANQRAESFLISCVL